MIFKTKKSIHLSSFIFALVLAVIGLSGCGPGTPHKIKLYQTLGARVSNVVQAGCPNYTWVYTDAVFPRACIQADDYRGTTANAVQIAGVCTTTVTDLTTTTAGALAVDTPIVIDCATGSLSSTLDYAALISTVGAFTTRKINDQFSLTVVCTVYGHERDRRTAKFTIPLASCIL